MNEDADVIAMQEDVPGPIMSNQKSRGIYSIGFQSLAD
jgi:hypothetical protein